MVVVRNLEQKEIKELVKKVIAEGKPEARFLLTIETWYRQGESFTDEARIEVVYGEIEKVELEEIDEGYPHRLVQKYAIIPKALPTVIVRKIYCDIPGWETEQEEIYVFTGEEWKKLVVEKRKRI